MADPDELRLAQAGAQVAQQDNDARLAQAGVQVAWQEPARLVQAALQVAIQPLPINAVHKVWWDGDEFNDPGWVKPVPVAVSPNGTCWAVTVDDDGVITTVKLEDL